MPRKTNTKSTASRRTQTGLQNKLSLNLLKHRRTALVVMALAVLGGAFVVFRSLASPGSLSPAHTYTDWVWEGSQRGPVNNSIEGSLFIETDTTKVHPSIGYYHMNAFFFNCQGCNSPNGSAYMGIQTNGEAGKYRGKVAIFSVFGAAISAEAGSAGSVCSLHGAGFDGYSHSTGSTCRIPLNWQAGEQYTVRTQLIGGDASGYIWQAVVRNNATGQELVIGKIKTPIAWSKIQGYLINNTEYYSPGRAECDAPYSKVVFGYPKVNGSIAPNSHSNYLGANKGCNQSNITSTRSGIRHEMGNPAITGVPQALPAGGTYVSDMSWTSAVTGYGVITKDQSVNNNGTPINLAGKAYAKGIGTHAISDIRYNLGGKYSKFVSYVNLQYGAGGTVTYQVWADGTKLFDSGPLGGLSYTKAVNVDVTGKKELKLIVTDGGDGINGDWAAWADARLIASSPPPTTPPASTPGQNQGDVTAPSVKISSPLNGSRIYNGTYIAASSSDNVGVKKIELYIDGVLKSSAISSSISYTWTSYYAAAGNHTIAVKAYDEAGNVGQTAVTVTK